jgi:predicted nuclease of restriction endonuclease-like RecB superfamily
VTVVLGGSDLAERRALFRQLRFRRLMGEVRETGGRLAVELSGPLGIFDQAASYGMRLATFFPHVLHLKDWELTADVHINKKELTLRLGPEAGLVSHYRQHTPHVPAELLACIDAFNARTSEWRAAPGGDFVHLGRESYCFPDLTITRQDGAAFHVELFHRWHAAQLGHRLQALENNPVSHLLLGVARNLARTADEALAGSGWFAKHGFIFTDFPTPKALLARLATYGKV